MNEFRIFYIADLMEKISIIDLKSVIFFLFPKHYFTNLSDKSGKCWGLDECRKAIPCDRKISQK